MNRQDSIRGSRAGHPFAPRSGPVVIGLAAIALIVAACTSASPSPSSSALATPGPSDSAQPTVAPTSTPAASEAAVTPGPSPTDCALAVADVELPSDRLIDTSVTSGANSDQITFVFDQGSLPGPAGTPSVSVAIAPTPYSFAGSGAEIPMSGEHVLLVRFDHMSLANDVGQETYVGDREYEPGFSALRKAILFDESEGVVGWYVGYDGTGCVTMDSVGSKVTLTIDHS